MMLHHYITPDGKVHEGYLIDTEFRNSNGNLVLCADDPKKNFRIPTPIEDTMANMSAKSVAISKVLK
jgi:hypothetical protein